MAFLLPYGQRTAHIADSNTGGERTSPLLDGALVVLVRRYAAPLVCPHAMLDNVPSDALAIGHEYRSVHLQMDRHRGRR